MGTRQRRGEHAKRRAHACPSWHWLEAASIKAVSKDVDHSSFLDKAHTAIRKVSSGTAILQNFLSDVTQPDALVQVFVKLGGTHELR
ncbi:hypothetical protein LMG28138_05296 [Pararobbsia alpina]|uniref:Uncharacterized protein n=1 Tax=Pararobbsia alpina TaxID=621374 RepID=A0A6S7C7Y9_9BURK|nr:hypothetical protein LMG28138_05296 [Pararobbsia alpina]